MSENVADQLERIYEPRQNRLYAPKAVPTADAELALLRAENKKLRNHIKAIDSDADGPYKWVPLAWFKHLVALSESEGRKMMDYKVWDCKIVISADEVLPEGFDFPLRRAAIETVEKAGIEILHCLSGWGGKLTEDEQMLVDRDRKDITSRIEEEPTWDDSNGTVRT